MGSGAKAYGLHSTKEVSVQYTTELFVHIKRDVCVHSKNTLVDNRCTDHKSELEDQLQTMTTFFTVWYYLFLFIHLIELTLFTIFQGCIKYDAWVCQSHYADTSKAH